MGITERYLFWESVDGNVLWLRAKMSRYSNPSSFAMAMAPERNANTNDKQFKEILDWIRENRFPAKYLTDGLLAFETENDKLIFLIKWS